MQQRSITIEVVVDGLTIRKELPAAWSGGNPIYHAKEFRPVADRLVQEVDDILSKHFGDIRGRDL